VLEGACRAAPTVLALVLGSKSPCCSESTRLSSVVRDELCIKNVILHVYDSASSIMLQVSKLLSVQFSVLTKYPKLYYLLLLQ